MISPIKTVLFMLCAGFLLLLSTIAIPKDGISVVGFNIKMPSLKDFILKDTTSYADISDIVSNINDIDSLPDVTVLANIDSVQTDTIIDSNDTLRANAVVLADKANIYHIEFPNDDKTNLFSFFDKLKTKKRIRIMHYGDSQIEGDRITSFIRNKLQKTFGGSGPGLIPALQPYNSYFSMKQENEGNWKRYSVFGRIDTNVRHSRYGPLAAFSRFAPLSVDSLISDSVVYTASVIFDESKVAYSSVRSFQKVRILYGNALRPVEVKYFIDDQFVDSEILEVGTSFSECEIILPSMSKKLRLEFSGSDSPDIYGVALEAKDGISVDNIGMRGCSGTIFNKMDFAHLYKSYQKLDVDMFIMQFGGNVMPYVKDSAAAINYGRWFKSQLLTIKKMCPKAALVVIGPSDMSYKEGEKYVTYPFLELVRDELRKATFGAGYAYWDMYEAMGGYNSMPSWVRAEPALAGSDYTHFTPRGAKLVANMFYNALMIESLR